MILLNTDTPGGGGTTTVTPSAPVHDAAPQNVPKGSTQQEPPPAREPTAKELEQEFTLDDINENLLQLPPTSTAEDQKKNLEKQKKDATVTPKPTDKKPTEKKEEAPKKEVPTKEDKVEPVKGGVTSVLKPPQKKEVDTKTSLQDTKATGVVEQTGTRDYSGFSPEDAALLKQMSKPAFDRVVAIMKENNVLKNSTYLQHEQAYQLDPSYQQVRQEVNGASAEADYWKNQILLMEQGKKWTPLLGYDKQTGEPVWGDPKDPTTSDKLDAQRALQACDRVIATKQGELQQFPQRYKQQVSGDLAAIEAVNKEKFEWEKNPEILDYTTMSVGPDGQAREMSIKDIRNQFINIWPPYMRGQPAVRVCANLFAALNIAQNQINQLQSGQAVQQTIQEEQTEVEPTSQQRKPAPKGSDKEVVFTADPEFVRQF